MVRKSSAPALMACTVVLNIRITGDKYDRQRRTEFAQALLQFRTAQSRYPHVEEDAARHTFARQADQQMQGRSIGRHLVTGVFQTTFHRFPEGRIVVDNVHEALHGLISPQRQSQGIKQLQPEHVSFVGFVRLADPIHRERSEKRDPCKHPSAAALQN